MNYPDIIVQARMTSSRLPGKVMKKILNKPMLFYLIERLKRVKKKRKIIIACTDKFKDDQIVSFCLKEKVLYFRGSERNVLERYYKASEYFKSNSVVRITADCPLIDEEIIDEVIEVFLESKIKYDYVSNMINPLLPLGMSVEIFSKKALNLAFEKAKKSYELEHVTPFFYNKNNSFNIKSVTYKKNLSHIRLTVDTIEDFELVSLIYKNLYVTKKNFSLKDVLKFLKKRPDYLKINEKIRQKHFKEVSKNV